MVMFSDIAAFAEAKLGAKTQLNGPDFEVGRVATISSWVGGTIAFSKVIDSKLIARATKMDRGALIVPMDGIVPDCPSILTESPRHVFGRIVSEFFVVRTKPGIHPTALIDPSACVDRSATIGPYCTIGPNVTIGPRTVLHNHVAISSNVEIGADCVLWSHCVIGEDGFGIEKDRAGNLARIPHIGGVRIGKRVHIGNFTSVVGGTIEPTVIEDGAMIDNLVHIAHNAHIGENCQIIACAEVSGSVRIGRNVQVAPNAAIIQKVEIGENSIIGLGAAVTQSIPAGVIAAGVPAKVIRHINLTEKDE